MVMVAWLFLLLVITSSYTASLTSILTVQQLSSPITGIDSLIASNSLIGYQVGSFAYSYLKDILNIAPSRLKSLRSPEEFEMVLRRGSGNGGVMAVVDELPYIELFLQNRTDFGIIGRPFTKSGWGFVSGQFTCTIYLVQKINTPPRMLHNLNWCKLVKLPHIDNLGLGHD